MELINATGMQAGYTMGIEPSGRERLVVAVKGTFDIPDNGGTATLAREQAPLIMADQFHGEPGYSSPLYEVDYAPVKPRCDVLLNGSAHAPRGEPTTRVQVGLKLGTVAKTFSVWGDRVWQPAGPSWSPSRANPFVTMPITYERAFGGVDDLDPDPARHGAYMANPIGRGYHEPRSDRLIDGTPVPNTEEVNDAIRSPHGRYRPMSLGAVGRGWQPRLKYAGTYDQNWLDNVFPFLPADFDDRYYQAAPEDQQTERLRGGEEVMLYNLTPEGRTRFRLPEVEVPVVFFRKRGGQDQVNSTLDTIVIEPDRARVMLTWRSSLSLKRNMFEFVQVVAGHMPRGWWRARELGKTYYPSLGTMVRTRRGEEEAAE